MLRKLSFFAIILTACLLVLPSVRPDNSHDGGDRMVAVREKDLSLNSSTSFFVENRGQWSDDITHVAQTSYGQMGVSRDSMYFHLMNEEKDDVVRYFFLNSKDPAISSDEQVPGVFNYLIGEDSFIDARQFRKVELKGVWKGVDLRATACEEGSKYEFVLAPFADPADISVRVDGARSIDVAGNSLIIDTISGRGIEDSGLIVFYEDDPDQKIEAGYSVEGSTFNIWLGDYDSSRSVVIDPLVRSTYIGGSSNDASYNMVLDDDENFVYFVGETYSSNFPITPGCYDSSHNSGYDAYVCKMDVNLSTLYFSTFIGGSSSDYGLGLDIDSSGNMYLCGRTYSSNFPTTSGANDTTLNGSGDAFVLKLSSSGSTLLLSTFYGGSGADGATDIRVDTNSNIYVIGETSSSDLYTTSGSFDGSFNGQTDIFAVKFRSSGADLLYSTYIGGSSYDYANRMLLDGSGNVIFTGSTRSLDYPVTNGAYRTSMTGSEDVVVTKINSVGSSLFFSTYFGGSITQEGWGISRDIAGNFYITGYTNSLDLPVTSGCNQSTNSGGYDAFIFKLGSAGSTLHYCTYFGGSSSDYGIAVDVDGSGYAVVTGYTRSSDLYTSKKAEDRTINGYQCTFISRLDPQGANMVYSSYIGGTNYDYGESVRSLSNGEAMLVGTSSSTAYPTTNGAYSRTHGGSYDTVLSTFNFTTRPDPPTDLTGVFTYGSVELSWEPPEDDGGMPLRFYRIYKGEIGAQLVYYKDTTDLGYTDLNITPGIGYKYTVRAVNSRGESEDPEPYRAEDLEPPVLEEDLTAKNATTGDRFFFVVNASDNIHVKEVAVTYRYGLGDIFQENLERTEGVFRLEITVKNDLDPIKYQIMVKDDFNNQVLSEWKNITIFDDDVPVFLEDITETEGTTGERHVFKVRLKDNIGIRSVDLHYRYGEGPMEPHSMERQDGGWWNIRIDVPDDCTDDLYYLFTAVDGSGNQNSSTEARVNISDNDPVVFLEDLSQTEATTGDPFHFRINVTDNIAVLNVNVEYWFGEGEVQNMEMEDGEMYRATIKAPLGSTDELYYRFRGVDLQGNVNSTETVEVSVIDNDLPRIEDLTGSDTGTGQVLVFSASLDDNIGIDRAKIVYRFGEGSEQDRLLVDHDGTYRAELKIPRVSIEDVYYHIEAYDAHGNRKMTEEKIVLVRDVIPPDISDMVNITLYQGKILSTKLETEDNIGVTALDSSGSPIEPFFVDENNTIIQMRGHVRESGVYPVEITAGDAAGNTVTTSFTITVLPFDNDIDGDDIPDLVELENGLDMNDPSDASRDKDGDGLSNLEEYRLGTNITNIDTDSDGMDDEWEVKYGLDPLNASGYLDTDGDGLTDLEEYRRGSDPTLKESEGFPLLAVVIIAVVVLVVVLVVLLIVKARRREGKGEPKKKEPPQNVPPPEEVFRVPASQLDQPLPLPSHTGELPQPVPAEGELPQPYPAQDELPPAGYDEQVQYDDLGRQVFYDEQGYPYYIDDETGQAYYYEQTDEYPQQYEGEPDMGEEQYTEKEPREEQVPPEEGIPKEEPVREENISDDMEPAPDRENAPPEQGKQDENGASSPAP
ncbi:MAG: fibronectin type III domain-containing protein [Thermoplasmatota archaeon]